MNRRSMLAAVGMAMFGSGCTGISGNENEQDPSNKFETCPLDEVALNDLPEPARQEMETALDNDGRYETSGPTYIENVIDPDRTVIEVYDEADPDPYTHYEVAVTEGTTKRIELTETLPPATAAPIVYSEFRSSVTVTLQVEGEHGSVVDLTIDSQSERFDDGLVLDQHDWRYGDYVATLEFQETSYEEMFSLDGSYSDNDRYWLSIDADSMSGHNGDSQHFDECRWDDDGSVDVFGGE